MHSEEVYEKRFIIRGGDFANGGEVSCKIRNLLKEIGISSEIIRRVSIASYEAEMNVIMYAREGIMNFIIAPERIKIIVEDQGPGIEDIELAMQEGYSTATEEMREMGFGAGMGLPNIKKNADEFKISSVVGQGTKLEITVGMNGKK
ncbi:MAG: ATP-binding protein [Candidatus Edwardsbacteria bacterium]